MSNHDGRPYALSLHCISPAAVIEGGRAPSLDLTCSVIFIALIDIGLDERAVGPLPSGVGAEHLDFSVGIFKPELASENRHAVVHSATPDRVLVVPARSEQHSYAVLSVIQKGGDIESAVKGSLVIVCLCRVEYSLRFDGLAVEEEFGAAKTTEIDDSAAHLAFADVIGLSEIWERTLFGRAGTDPFCFPGVIDRLGEAGWLCPCGYLVIFVSHSDFPIIEPAILESNSLRKGDVKLVIGHNFAGFPDVSVASRSGSEPYFIGGLAGSID